MTKIKFTEERLKFIHGEPMNPCPKCGGFEIKWQTPIVCDEINPDDGARQILKVWAKAIRAGPKLKGPVFLMCFGCGHCGPSVDCSGRSRDDVGSDRVLAKEVRRLWNLQKPFSSEITRTE